MAARVFKTMKYFKSVGSSMIRRRRKVHAETTEDSFLSVSVNCPRAGEEEEEDENANTTFGHEGSSSEDDCDSVLSEDTINGTRYRTLTLYGLPLPNALQEGGASPQSSTRVLRLRMSDLPDDLDSDMFSLSSFMTRYGEGSDEASDDEDVWESDSYVLDEVN
eukprot:TRINITY_DN59673_c0_g1_i1.p1 TRINITY_DN59673_c0_g1~~TRINITY_DN59673_c0_g1_i1.p1  ORF type:complete len:185 (-),score=30.40 TRINITY_DN59673_c0_g1_i1:67-555(-)